jgi:hypothetical protein
MQTFNIIAFKYCQLDSHLILDFKIQTFLRDFSSNWITALLMGAEIDAQNNLMILTYP